MMSVSCPGFLDQYGIWNNGFDCSSPRICCGTETDRYCCIPAKISTSPSSTQAPYPLTDDLEFRSSGNSVSEKWFFLQICITGILLAITLLIILFIYQCLTTIRRNRQNRQQRMSIVHVPLPTASPIKIEYTRPVSNRISTVSSIISDTKSRCTDTSTMFNTPLNVYPTAKSRSSTSTSSSYYLFPNEYEHLCR